jgi:hypothetical protein
MEWNRKNYFLKTGVLKSETIEKMLKNMTGRCSLYIYSQLPFVES